MNRSLGGKSSRSLIRLGILLTFFLEPLYGQNILLVSIDTLRADRLSCYGYRQSKTPAIDRWAAEGIRFENAYSEYPLTLPAHATLLTGLYPFTHGVRENVGFSLATGHVALAEILKKNGYATGGFIGSYVLASEFGISQGFDVYDDGFGIPLEKALSATALRRPAAEVADRFLAWLAGKRERKFFAFVHFYDPHAPCPGGYDAQVSNADRAIGRIDAVLRKQDLLDKTHIFLVSDHGEALGEHRESGHGFFLYDGTLRVPLIVRPAAVFQYRPRVSKPAVSLVDVMPTILQMAGIKGPAVLQGKSLVRVMAGKDSVDVGQYAETYVPQLHFGWSPLRSLRLGRYKFVDAPRAELYDIAADPGEKENVIQQNQALAGQYRAQLGELVARHQSHGGALPAAGPALEASEKLAALGYVQLGKMKVRGEFGKGIDPKDRIDVFEGYHEILNDIGGGRDPAWALTRIETLRRLAPELRQLVFLEARVYEGLGRFQDAHAKYLQGLKAEPENHIARAQMASLLVRLGKLDDAEREFRQVLAADPGDYRSRNNLAGILGMKGDAAGALAQLKRALATRPWYAAAWHNLGQLQSQAGNLQEAHAALRKAVELDRSDATGHFLLAQVLRALKRTVEADEHLRIALELNPGLAPRARENPTPRP